MRTINAFSGLNLISQTPELWVYPNEINPSAQAFYREVFDDLMDKNLLGLLFSASHLHRYLAAFATYASSASVGIVNKTLSNTPIFEAFHKMMLKKFKGIYIEEASINDYTEVLASLDQTYQEFGIQLKTVANTHTPAQTQFEDPQHSWKYRNSCLVKALTKQN